MKDTTVPVFNQNDLRVYAAVRRLEKTRVLELSRETKLAKSTVQGALARLKQRGLVSRTARHGVPLIRARGANNVLQSLVATRQRLTARHEAQNKLLLQWIGALQRLQGNAPRRRKSSRRIRH